MPEEAADNATQTPNTPSDPTALHCLQGGHSKRRSWHILDVFLLGSLFLFGAFGYASPLLFYIGGMRNDMWLPFGAAICFLLLVPLAVICLLAVMIRVAWYWPRYIDRRRKLLISQIVTIVVSVVYIGLPFLGIGPPGYKTYTLGLRKYALKNVDVTAARTWLSSLDPNDCDGLEIDVRWGQDGEPVATPPSVVLPACLASLQPRYVRLALVGERDLAVALTWGSGLLGAWGLTVGPETMEAPPSVLSSWPDYSLDVSPGVRVWWLGD